MSSAAEAAPRALSSAPHCAGDAAAIPTGVSGT